jgi:hypothetical protein
MYSGSSDDEFEPNICAGGSVAVAVAVSETGDDTGAESERAAMSFVLPSGELP